MSRSFSSSHSRRRGQALLLAVLIMIFAALLSASFLVVVSVNLNQTARQTDKNRSLVAANAGLAHIKQQIAYSAEGDKWRTELENVPPAPGDIDYAAYYTPLDMAQGWARDIPHPGDENGNGKFYNGTNRNTIDPGDEKIALDRQRRMGKLELVKSPDPRSFGNQASESPTYLSQVEQVPNSAGYELAGALKVTVIGLSTEDPTAYTRTVAYIGGNNSAPIARTMWTVGNYDFKNNVVPVAQAGAFDVATNQLTLSNVSGNFPDAPFTVMIGDPQTNIGLRGATVSAKTVVVTATATTTTLTLAQPIAPAIQTDNAALNLTGERVELAANLGAPATIDINNDGAATESVDFKTSDPTYDPTPTPIPGATPTAPTPTPIPTPQPGGIRANGGLWLQGNINAEALGGTQNAYTAANPIPASIKASGLMAFNAPVTTVFPAPTATPAPIFLTGPAFPSATPAALVGSTDPNFPGTGMTWPASAQEKDRIVSDGMNRFKGVPSTNNATRSTTEFRPPNIASGQGADRYRNIARSSGTAFGYMGSVAALYGYGQGIYIDNAQDRERILVSATPTLTYRDMTQTELVQMWLSRFPTSVTAVPDYSRTGVALAPTIAGSLEQKHLRGWVGPDEFRGRGSELVLGNDGLGNAIVTVTRDARDDANPLGGSANTTWKDPTGMALSGVYTKVLPWPTTGVIFAEGNVRIRGNAVNVPNSLTVVSMGNIYIEDSLSADADLDGNINTPVGVPRRILLMAKKNVVMNPTRVMGRPDAQTTVNAVGTITPATSTTPAMQTLTVADGLSFKVGDYVQAFDTTGNVTGQGSIVAPAPTTTQINISYLKGTVAIGNNLRTPNAIPQVLPSTLAPTRSLAFTPIISPNDVMQRRLFLESTPAILALAPNLRYPNLRLAFNHQADRVPILTISVKTSPNHTAPMQPIYLSNKGVPSTVPPPYFDVSAAVVSQSDKKMRGQFTEPATGNDDFPGSPPVTEDDPATGARTAPIYLLKQFAQDISSRTNDGVLPTDVGWRYDAPAALAAYDAIPFFYLAGFGNRYDFGVPPTGETRKDIRQTPYPVPLAVSVGLALNSAPVTVYDEHYNTTISSYDRTRQFGFSPTFLDTVATVAMPPVVVPTEDIITSDQGFYQTDVYQSTLDSRSTVGGSSNPPTLGFIVGDNGFVLRQSDNLVQPVGTNANFPTYRLMDTKLENVALTADATTGVVTTATVDSAYTFNVNAYVYAQTGSWFVIPGPAFDDRLKTSVAGTVTTTYLDLNANSVADAGEYLLDPVTSNNFPDLNRNGAIEDNERHAFERYSRFNYQINFSGAVAENQTAIVNTVYNPAAPTQIIQPGAVDDWMNKWITTKYTTPPLAVTPTVSNDRIHYVFDPTVALNNFQVSDEGFKLPQTSEVFYQD